MHEDPRHGEFRQHDRVARPDHRVRILHEHVERARLALRVLPVIGDAGENLARPRQRRAQPHFFERDRGCRLGQLVQRRAQTIEVVDDALHGELRRVALLRTAAEISITPRSVSRPGKVSPLAGDI